MSEAGYARSCRPAPERTTRHLAYCATCHGRSTAMAEIPSFPASTSRTTSICATRCGAYYRRHTAERFHGPRGERGRAPTPSTSWRAISRASSRRARAGKSTPNWLARGRELALGLAADDDVPACAACHGPEATRRFASFPVACGAARRRSSRRSFGSGAKGGRGGGARAELMHEAAHDLSDADIAALAAFYSGLAPAKLP